MKHFPLSDDRRPALRSPQFSTQFLLAGVAVLSGLFAVTHYFGSYGAAIAILFALCVAMHVIGNVLGTRLRDFGDRSVKEEGTHTIQPTAIRRLTTSDFAPRSGLGQRTSLGRRISVLTLTGAISGGLFGLFGIEWLAGESTGWSVLCVGALACAVLAGIGTYACTSFLIVTVGELLQAGRDSRSL